MNTIRKAKAKRSLELQARIDRTRASAHKEVVSAGKIQFRLDPETMDLLLRTSDERGTGAGVLARMWVVERLRAETSGKQNPIEDLDRRLSLLERKIARRKSS